MLTEWKAGSGRSMRPYATFFYRKKQHKMVTITLLRLDLFNMTLQYSNGTGCNRGAGAGLAASVRAGSASGAGVGAGHCIDYCLDLPCRVYDCPLIENERGLL